MAKFDIYQSSTAGTTLLLDLQDELLDTLSTRVLRH